MPPDCISPTTEPSEAPQWDDHLLCMTHELRTIVQSLRLVAEGLAATPLTAEQQRLIGVLRATIGDAGSLVTSAGLGPRAGDVSQHGAKQSVNATDVVREVIAVAEVRACHKGIALRKQLPAAPVYLPPTLASVLRLSARNLISNAITHTHEGSVTVSLTDGDSLELSVADSGSGIAPQDLPHVFKKGYRAGGSLTDGGLGLAIVKEAVEGVGGEVAVAETSAQGTRFIVRLPRVEPKGESCPETCGKVLIADDSASIRELMAMIVSGGGYEVVVAADGAEAVAHAANTIFAVVILDQNMPGLTGSEAAARIQADAMARGAARPAFIALSGEPLADNSGEGSTAVDNGLWRERWHKPIGREDILAGLARVLGRSPPASE